LHRKNTILMRKNNRMLRNREERLISGVGISTSSRRSNSKLRISGVNRFSNMGRLETGLGKLPKVKKNGKRGC
jgi:hypothetical protein